MSERIPPVIEEDSIADFAADSRRTSLSLSPSPSLNDDLLSRLSNQQSSTRRSFETSSIITSSFRPSFDDSYQSLGFNKLSAQDISPLGPNSIYELIADIDSKKQSTASYLSPRPQHSHSHGGKINIKPPTVEDIPPIALTKVQKVPKEEVKEYLNKIDIEYKKYSNNKKLTENLLNSFVNNKSISLEQEVDKLESIPQIYFKDEFNLDDPRIFKIVLQGSKIENLQNDLIDKLSYYLDIVEVHLVNEISKSSSSFFDALNDLSEIQDKNNEISKLNDQLISQISKLNDNKIQPILEIIEINEKRQQVLKFEQLLLQLNKINYEFKESKQLFLKNNNDDCLNKLEFIELLIKGNYKVPGWKFNLENVENLTSLIEIKNGIKEFKMKVGDNYSAQFIELLLNDLRSHYEQISYQDSFERLLLSSGKNGTNNGSLAISEEFRLQINELIIGITRCKDISKVFADYEVSFYNEIKNIIRVLLPNEDVPASSTTDSSISTSKQNTKKLGVLIRELSPTEFQTMLIRIYCTLTEALKRVKVHQKFLLDSVLNNIDSNDINYSKLDITDGINNTINIVQVRMQKVIKTREKLNANLTIDYFLRFYYINNLFINECENLSGLSFEPLIDSMNSQIKNFDQTFQQNNLRKLSFSIENEDWKPVIVPKDIQNCIIDIVDNNNLDLNQEWKKPFENYFSQKESPLSQPPSTAADQYKKQSHKRSIVVGDKTFVASNSLLTLITIVRDYFVLKANFPQSTTYEPNILELFKYYNNKSMHIIRKQDGSLNKDINLSIVGESLDCLLEIIHYVRLSFDNIALDDAYNTIISSYSTSKSKIDSVNMFAE